MSIREHIAFLEDLSAIDVEIRRIDEQLGTQRADLSGKQSEVKDVEKQLGTDRERLAEMEKTRNELTIELRQMSQQIERSREKLGRSRNERESNAAQRELEELRKLCRDREDEIGKIHTLSELARKSIEEGDTRLRDASGVLEGTAEGAVMTLAELEKEKAERLEQRRLVVSKLPVVLFRRYESLRTRRPVAIAKTHDGTCLGCHISVPPMMYQKMLRQEEFEQCPNCRRILYYVPAPTDADSVPVSGSRASQQSNA